MTVDLNHSSMAIHLGCWIKGNLDPCGLPFSLWYDHLGSTDGRLGDDPAIICISLGL